MGIREGVAESYIIRGYVIYGLGAVLALAALPPSIDRVVQSLVSRTVHNHLARMARNRGNDDSSSDNGSNDHDHRKDKKPKSRKPPNTAFRQQRLLAYAPILTPKTVLPLFFAVGIIFGPIGGLLLYASSKV
jgi:hypothetical protein